VCVCVWEGGVHSVSCVYIYFAVPLKAPNITSANRTEAKKLLVKWEYLKLEDLRGNLVSYEIAYYDLLNQQCPAKSAENTTISERGGDSYAVIANLEPTLEYCVAVAAKTGAGVGEFSYITIPCMSTSEKNCLLCA